MADNTVIARYYDDESSSRLISYQSDGTSRTYEAHDGIVQEPIGVGQAVVFGVGSDATGRFEIVVWDPEADKSTVVYESDSWSEYTLSGTDFYFTAPGSAGEHCIARVDFADPLSPVDDEVVSCVDAGSDIGWLKSSGGDVSFLTRTEDDECWAVNRIHEETGEVEELAVPGCASRAVVGNELVVWNETATGGEDDGFFHTELVALGEGEPISLGDSVAGSQVFCGDWLYWLTERSSPTLEHSEIRRWRGGADVETVYISPDGDTSRSEIYSTSGPQCDGDERIFFQRLGWWSGAGDELLSAPGIDWEPQVELSSTLEQSAE
ncbi:hypothetical protein [Demequina aurantiaca]|uniref:hypothetical protein n=1 Tax=Demequina aurantiaca TaxID=676200 RepID=UPI003D32A791